MNKFPKRRHCLAFLLLIVNFGLTQAQFLRLPATHFTIDDGLANNDVYVAIQDHEGKIWFTTDNGLSNFDGKKFTNYFQKNGLLGNSLSGITRIGDTLFVASYKKGIQKIYRGKILSDILLKFSESHVPVNYLKNINNRLFVGMNYINPAAEAANFFYSPHQSIKNNILSLESNTESHYYQYAVQSRSKVQLLKDGVVFQTITLKTPEKIHYLYEAKEGTFLLQYDNLLCFYSPKGELIKKINIPDNSPFNIVIEDEFGRVWCRNLNGKGFVYQNNHFESLAKALPIQSNTPIRGFYYDENNKNIWVLTGGEGVFCVHSPFLQNYDFEPIELSNRITSLEMDSQQRLWVGTENQMALISGNTFQKINLPIKPIPFVKQLINWNNSMVVITPTLTERSISITQQKQKLLIKSNATPSLIVFQNNIMDGELSNSLKLDTRYGRILVPVGSRATEVKQILDIYSEKINNNQAYFKRPFLVNSFFLSKDTLWLCSTMGLGKIIGNRLEFPYENIPVLNENIKFVQKSPNGDLCVVTENAFGVLHGHNWHFFKNNFQSIAIKNIQTFVIDKEGYYWFGTNEGVKGIHENRELTINKNTGLCDDNIKQFKYDFLNDRLWIGTQNGLACLDVRLLKDFQFHSPALKISKIKTLENPTFDFSKPIEIDYKSKYIQASLASASLQFPKNIQLLYALDDSTQWHSCDSLLSWVSLNYGEHRLYVKSKTTNSDWSPVKRASFSISTPFYYNLWFWLLLISGITLFSMWRMKRQKDKTKLNLLMQQENVMLRLQSLSAMMNPHFIFNALVAIQFKMTPEGFKQAQEYIGQMSELVRMNLQTIVETEISVHQEIERLKLYLSLEKLRFEEYIHYQIRTVEANPSYLNYLMPTMMLQPFVENAIWHGISPPTRHGTIDIQFRLVEADLLHVCIKDDGVGYGNAPKRPNHISRGTAIIRERIEMMNKLENHHRNRIEIALAENKGTVVNIYLVLKIN